MKKLKIKPRKEYGQHFLTAQAIAKRILDFADIKPDDTVLEIGPGTGSLTRILSARAAQTLAVEVDPYLYELLTDQFQQIPSAKIICADFLTLDLGSFLKHHLATDTLIRVVGNLPYNRATAIVEKLFAYKKSIRDMTVTVQAEVADRFQAEPNSKEYGYLTNLVQYHTNVNFGFDIGPNFFNPPPKVYSSVIKLTILDKPKYESKNYELYLHLLKSAFAHRRKTIFNNLKVVPGFSENLHEILRAGQIDPMRRAESLSLQEFVALSNAFCAHQQGSRPEVLL